MRKKLLLRIATWAADRTGWMIAIIVVLTLVAGILAEHIEINMNLTGLLPEEHPMAKEFERIFEEFNGANTVFLVVQGEPQKMIEFANHIGPQIKNLETWIEQNGSAKVQKQHQRTMQKVASGETDYMGQYFDRVDEKLPVEFMRDHGIMLMKRSDLKNTAQVFTDPNFLPLLTNLNNSLEQEYIQSEEKISTIQQERSAVRFLDGIETWVNQTRDALYQGDHLAQKAATAADAVGIGNPYLFSPDRSMLLIMVEPTFSILNMDFVMPAINGLEELVKTEAAKYKLEAGLTGGAVLSRDEMVAGTEDSMFLTLLALIAVVILFIVTFRMVSAPVLALINLMIGIVWAMGVSYLLVHTLNLFTLMVSVILVGLGIDFSIHIISVFSELVYKKVPPREAIRMTLQKVGTGIITGAFTTAAAFLTLYIGRSSGMKELGLVTGMGLLTIMLSTLLTLPTLLMLRSRYRRWRGKAVARFKDVSYRSVGNLAQNIFSRWRLSLVSLLIVTIFLGIMVTRVSFDYNYLNMEPKGLESIKLHEKIIDKYNMSSDATRLTASSLPENYRFTQEAKEKSSVSYVESLTDYLPPENKQIARRPTVDSLHNIMQNKAIQTKITPREWRQILDEMFRLEANIIEIQDMAFIGGQDMVDDKAARLVGDANIARSMMDLNDLVSQSTVAEAHQRLQDIIKMLARAQKDQNNQNLKQDIQAIKTDAKTLAAKFKKLPQNEKQAELRRLQRQLTQIGEYKAVRGRLSDFINQMEQEPVDLTRFSAFNQAFGKTYQKLVLNMADTSQITMASLPAFVKDKYISKNGELFLITVYPKGDIWNIKYLEQFTEQTREITHHIAGTPPMFYVLIKIIGRDGRNAAVLTLIVVFLLLLADFKSFSQALLAMVPLITGFVWMLGIMGLTGVQMTLVNIMALPLILGIGIDDGVHLLHRYRIEGKGAIKAVYRSTGKAITITSLTTMLAFGSLVFARYRGYGSLGIALFIGVGACLLTSILILPAILGMTEK